MSSGSHGFTGGAGGSHGGGQGITTNHVGQGTNNGAGGHGITTGGMGSHEPTAGGMGSHGPTASGMGSHGPTAGGRGITTNQVGHGTSNGAGGHGLTTNSIGGPGNSSNDGGITHGVNAGGSGHSMGNGAHFGSGSGAGSHGGNGGRTASASLGHTATGGIAPNGANTHFTKGGGAFTTRSNGKISDVHDSGRGIDVHHELNGNRRILAERPNHGRIVSERGRPGYAQRGYGYHGHDYGRRAYYDHGHEYNRYYHGYGYRGMYMNVYAPGYYYAPAFYGWAYNPWPAPIAFGWGWGGSPWYGFYGGFFAPYSVYPSAAFWLTDYVISQDLQAAYAAHLEAGEVDGAPEGGGGSPALTPENKQQIADEVRSQLALENQERQQSAGGQDVDPGSSGIARILADVANGHPHVFVAGGPLDLVDADGKECSISDGDVLQLQTAPPDDATSADLFILASKGGQECAKADTVTVQLTDLQEMQNQLRASIDQGLQDLKAKQGTGGLPQAPPSAQAQPTQAPYAAIAPPPDPQDAAALQQQGQQADQAEQAVTADTSQGIAAPGAQSPQ